MHDAKKDLEGKSELFLDRVPGMPCLPFCGVVMQVCARMLGIQTHVGG